MLVAVALLSVTLPSVGATTVNEFTLTLIPSYFSNWNNPPPGSVSALVITTGAGKALPVLNNVIVTNVTAPDFKERQKPILLSYEFKANNQVKKAANEIYVVMDWDKEFSGLEFDEERKNDFEFNYKYFFSIQTELTVPEGYKVDYVPSSFKKTTPHYSFEGSYTNKGKTVVYNKTIIVNKPILLKKEFDNWNSFIKDINNFYNDQVVLVKQ